MPVITISRQTGSGGMTIGQRLAEHLHADYVNTQIIQQVAHRLGISEAVAAEHNERGEGFIERLARVLPGADPSLTAQSRPTMPLAFETTTESFVEITRQLVHEAAHTGNAVIFGHGAQYILAGQPEVLHVRFVAPLPSRIERVMRREGLSQLQAERRIHKEDQRRAGHIRQYYQADWGAPDPYHLILNTALWTEEACIHLVLRAVDELKSK